MHEEELKRLWEALTPHFDLGSYDDFAANMQTTENRKAFYDWAVSYEVDLGPYDDYEYALKKKNYLEKFLRIPKLWRIAMEKTSTTRSYQN